METSLSSAKVSTVLLEDIKVKSHPGGFGRPFFIFTAYFDHFHRVQQIIQRIRSVPEFMLPPQAGGDRQEGELIHVRAFGDQESGVAGWEPEAPAPKKPSSVQSTSSMVSFMQVATSCSSSM